MKTNNDRKPIKPILSSARKPPSVIIVLSDTDEEMNDPKDPKGSKNSKSTGKKIVTPDHNGTNKRLLSTTGKKSTAVLKEGFSRKRTGWKRPKVDLEPATSCQWSQYVRKREEEQQGSQWKNVISLTCSAAFRNPRNIVDHYLTHLRQLQGTFECPVEDCRMILTSSRNLKAHNSIFHQKTTGKKPTMASPATAPGSTAWRATSIKNSAGTISSASKSKYKHGQPPSATAAQATQSKTLVSTRVAVSNPNRVPDDRKRKHAQDGRIESWKKHKVIKIYTGSNFTSLPSNDVGNGINSNNSTSNNISSGNTNNTTNIDDNTEDDESYRTETDNEYEPPEEIVDSEAEGNDYEAMNSSYISDYDNPLPEVLGPFFTWLPKK